MCFPKHSLSMDTKPLNRSHVIWKKKKKKKLKSRVQNIFQLLWDTTISSLWCVIKGLGWQKHTLLWVLWSTASVGFPDIWLGSSATISPNLASLELYGLQGKQVHRIYIGTYTSFLWYSNILAKKLNSYITSCKQWYTTVQFILTWYLQVKF